MHLHNSVTVAVLKKFEKQELKKLYAFVNFNTEEKNGLLKKTLRFLISCAPGFHPTQCSKESLSNAVFKKKLTPALDKEINRLMSELKDEIEEFIIYKTAETDTVYSSYALASWYNSKNLFPQLQRVFKNMEQVILGADRIFSRDAYRIYLSAKINYHVSIGDRPQNYLLFKHMAEFMRNDTEIEAATALIGAENVSRVLPQNLQVDKKYLHLDFKEEARFFSTQLKFVQNPDYESYCYLKESIIKGNLLIGGHDLFRSVVILYNHVKYISHQVNLIEEYRILSKLELEIEKKLNSGSIGFGTFYHYLISLLDFKKYEEARTFIRTHKNLVMGIKDIENFAGFYEAFILYEENKLSDALALLNNTYAEVDLHKIEQHMLKIKIAYGLREPQLFSSYINNLRKFISSKGNKQYGDVYISNTLSIVRYLSKLFHIAGTEKRKLQSLKEKAEADKELYSKRIVIDKIDEKLRGGFVF
jgi:hypothetical protein